MTDQLDRLFADLRTETLAEVRPPGTAAARRTVSRRRIGTSAAAGAALLAVVAGVVTAQQGSDQPAERPPAAASQLSAWVNQATLAVGVDHSEGPADVLTTAGSTTFTTFGGDYEVKIVCAGDGTVTLTFDSGAAVANTVLVPCESPVSRPSVYTTVPVAGTLGVVDVRAAPDAKAAGHSAVAYQMKLSDESRERAAATALAALPRGTSGTTGASLLTVANGMRDGSVQPGRYRAWFTCLGTGTVRLTADLVTDESRALTTQVASGEVPCGTPSSVESVTFTVPSTGVDALDVTLTPDATAIGRAAGAFRVTRL